MNPRFKLGLPMVAIIAVHLLIAPAAPAATGKPEVAKPGLDQLVTGQGKVAVVIRTAPKLRKLTIKLEGKGVRGAFKQVRPGVWRANIGRSRLRTGRNHLVAATVDRAGRKGFVSSRFVLGKRRRGFLTVSAPKRVGSSVVAKVQMRSLPNLRFRAKLNGRGIANRFLRSFLPERTAHLGANDGLHFGRNVLKIVAARGNGTFDVERRIIFVRRDRPLVGAGPDRFTAGRQRIRLDGRRSRPGTASHSRGRASTSAGLRYRWKVVRRPKGSKAKPASPGAARTRFRPDAVGTYRLRLTVTDGSGLRGSDVVTVTNVANAPPLGIPIEAMLANSEESEFWVELGGERVGSPLHADPAEEPQESVAALFLDRLTLEVLHAVNFRGREAEADQLVQEMESYGQRALVVLYQPFPEEPTVSPAFTAAANLLGLESPPELTENGWSAIGVPGSDDGGTEAAGTNWAQPSAGRLRGYLARDSSGLFTVVSGSAVPFDSSAPGAPEGTNRIAVGGQVYESGVLACPGAGGLQVAIFYAETLELAHNATFTTNGCGVGLNSAALGEIGTLLGEVSSNGVEPLARLTGNKLIFIQSIGNPRNPELPTQWDELALELAGFGAVGAVLADATAGYAWIGGGGYEEFPLTEASQSLTGAPARITGILQPNSVGSYAPTVSSPTGTTPFDLAEIAYQPAQAWPQSETAGEKAALTYIADLLDLPQPSVESSCYVPPQPDVRSEYCNEKLRGEWAGFVGQVRSAGCGGDCQSEHGFSQEDWENVRAELVGRGDTSEFFEFNAVQSTWELVRALQTPFGASGVNAEVDLNKLATEFEQALQPPAESDAGGQWLSILSGLGYIASYFTGEDAEALVGTLSGMIGLGAEFANGPEGSPLLGEFRIEAADVAVDLAKNLQAGSGSIATVGELIVTDYGKLRAVAESPALAGFTPRTVEAATESLEAGSRQWIYKTLFPTAYEALNLESGTYEEGAVKHNTPLPSEATSYQCTTNFTAFGEYEEPYFPFASSPPAEYFYELPARALGVLVERNPAELPSRGGHQIELTSPPASLFEPVYKPVAEGGLGFYAPWFWRETFDFPGEVQNVKC